MKIPILSFLLIILFFSDSKAEMVLVGHGYLTVSVNDPNDEYPFVVAGSKFKDGTSAAKALNYIYKNWPNKKPPTLLYESHTKLSPKGEADLHKAVVDLSKQGHVQVIMMPAARGAIPEDWFTAAKLIQKHAEQVAASDR